MRYVLTVLFPLICASLAACGSSRSASPPPVTASPQEPAVSPAEPRPTLTTSPSDSWVPAPQIQERGFDVAFTHVSAPGYVTAAMVEVPDAGLETFAQRLVQVCESRGDCSTSPVESGMHDGVAYFGFKMVRTSPDGVRFGATIVRALPGTPYRAMATGMWPIEATPFMLPEFETFVSGLHVAGQPPPRPDVEGWFADPADQAFQLPDLE
jgi:hypothetical protein